MTKKRQPGSKASKAKPPKDLSAAPKGANVTAGVKLQPCFVKSWSMSA